MISIINNPELNLTIKINNLTEAQQLLTVLYVARERLKIGYPDKYIRIEVKSSDPRCSRILANVHEDDTLSTTDSLYDNLSYLIDQVMQIQ